MNFYEDRMQNIACRVYVNKAIVDNVQYKDDKQKVIKIAHLEHIVLRCV